MNSSKSRKSKTKKDSKAKVQKYRDKLKNDKSYWLTERSTRRRRSCGTRWWRRRMTTRKRKRIGVGGR